MQMFKCYLDMYESAVIRAQCQAMSVRTIRKIKTGTHGCIYVANEHPTFARTMLIVCQKLGISLQITLN